MQHALYCQIWQVRTHLVCKSDHVLQGILTQDHKPPWLCPAMCGGPVCSLQHLLYLVSAPRTTILHAKYSNVLQTEVATCFNCYKLLRTCLLLARNTV